VNSTALGFLLALLFDLFGFLDAVLRFVALSSQALMIGGVAFILLVVVPFRREVDGEWAGILRRCRLILRWGAGAAMLGASADIVLNVLLLKASADVPITQGLTASFVIAEMVRIGAAGGVFLIASNTAIPPWRQAGLAILAAILLIAAAATSHSFSRMTDRAPMALADAVHQLGASVWIGGIPYFVITLARTHDGVAWRRGSCWRGSCWVMFSSARGKG
jgi:putative copper resistance protein D